MTPTWEGYVGARWVQVYDRDVHVSDAPAGRCLWCGYASDVGLWRLLVLIGTPSRAEVSAVSNALARSLP